MTRNFEIVGIGPSTQEATLRPKKDLTMKKIELVGNSNGKLFLSLVDFDPNTPNIMGMLFNGKQVVKATSPAGVLLRLLYRTISHFVEHLRVITMVLSTYW